MFYNIVYTMWDYAKKQGGTTAQIFESLYDDLDAAYGHGKWRMSRDMDEQPRKGEHAIVFTYADGLDGDFQIFVQGRPKMAVVLVRSEYEFEGTFSGIAAVCCSARQAETIRALEELVPTPGATWTEATVEMHDIYIPMSRVEMAAEYADGSSEYHDAIKKSGVLSDEELDALDKKIARADEREKQS